MITIGDLDDASLGTVLDFHPGHFRFVASVNRRFRIVYHHTPKTIYSAAMQSDAAREILFEEDEVYVRTDGCRLAAMYGDLESLQWFRSRG